MDVSVDVTELLQRARRGDREAADALFAATYRDLRALARSRLRTGGRSTLLDTTALVNESYLRLASLGKLQVEDRAHFMRYAGRAMRSVIVDFARRRGAGRRGGGAVRVPITFRIEDGAGAGEKEILRVHEALEDLARLDARMAQVVEMRYFGGMSEREIAEALAVTDRTVRRDWEKARLWLVEALR
jgi:RNA polymerase sigma factor (TIGR02999 family)